MVGAHLRGARFPAYPPERSGVAEGELNAGCKSAALETAFVMGERRDVWYNMRMKGSVKTTQVESPRQEDDVRGGLLLK